MTWIYVAAIAGLIVMSGNFLVMIRRRTAVQSHCPVGGREIPVVPGHEHVVDHEIGG